MTAFAKAQLMKYGWTEGKGLGKNETGITVALRPKLKFDTVGIGHKETDTNAWWETVFDKAANNIKLDFWSENVPIPMSKPDGTEKKPDKPKRSSGYGNFLKMSTLQNGTMIPEAKPESKEAKKPEDIVQTQLTDEELFKACGGRTAHKGARHGFKLNGKLERIARQERELLARTSFSFDSHPANRETCSRSDERSSNNEFKTDGNANTVSPHLEDVFVSKGKRKRHNKRVNKLVDQLNVSWSLVDERDGEKAEEKPPKEKRKRKRKGEDGTAAIKELLGDEDAPMPDIKKEKIEAKVETEEHSLDEAHEAKSKLKSRRKKKRFESKHQHWEKYSAKMEQRETLVISSKKSKKSRKEEIDLQLRIKEETKEAEDQGVLHKNRFDIEKFEEYDRRMSNDAERRNSRISKKKKLKSQRKEKVKLRKLTECLSAVHLGTEESTLKPVTAKTKVEAIVKDLMAVNLTEDVTKTVKKMRRRKRKEKRQESSVG